MNVCFTKTESGCKTCCTRIDGTFEEWESPDDGVIPHDMVHWIVENHLRLTESFYSHIAAGHGNYSVNELAHNESELANTELLVLLIQSEIASRNGSLYADPEAIRGMYGLNYPDSCSESDVETIIQEIHKAEDVWNAMGIAESVIHTFEWS